jgi:hypothetical protein
VVGRLEAYQDTVKTMKLLEMDPKESIPFNFLFRGPPGTGKTTTAKKIGKVFYDMGFLATTEVIECSASDLIGQYVGQTGPKVRQTLDKALGRVLFLDEAYRLCDGPFAKEAIDELVDAVTKDTYKKKLIIIMAGYEKDINRLMSINSGLTSRFPEVINFRALSPVECLDLLCKVLQGHQKRLSAKGHKLDLSSLETPPAVFRDKIVHWFASLREQDNWASARDVQTLAQGIFNKTIKGAQKGLVLVVQEGVVEAELKAMFDERNSRAKGAKPGTSLAPKTNMLDLLPSQHHPSSSPPQRSTSTATKSSVQTAQDDAPSPPSAEEEPRKSEKRQAKPDPVRDAQRDAGVSDEVWEQLEKDKAAEVAREEEFQALTKAREAAAEAARELIIKCLLAKDEEDRRRQEEERRRQELLREQIAKQLQEAEERRKQQAAMRKKLAAAGVCPVGYRWIAQSGGYRCAGGSHYMSDGQLQNF